MPNPFHGSTTIQVSNHIGEISFMIYDIYGREIRIRKSFSDSFVFDSKNLPTGLYFYRIEGERGVIKSGKLLIE